MALFGGKRDARFLASINRELLNSIIDTEIEAPLEGKKAFEYVINQKYFNHPTNNVEYIKNGVPVPKIEEDSKAIRSGFINNLYK